MLSKPIADTGRVAVCALVRRQDGRYLLVRRSPDIPGGGHWCPVTGRPQPSESLEDAVMREVWEEVGLRIKVGAEVFRCPTSDGNYQLHWFECSPCSPSTGFESLSLDTQEVVEASWLFAHEAMNLRPTFEATASFFADRAAIE